MRARVHTHWVSAPLEAALATAVALGVAWLMLSHSPGDRVYLHFEARDAFGAIIALGVWMPLFARWSANLVGDLRREGNGLVLRTRLRTVRIRAIRRAHLAVGARGASLMIEYGRRQTAAIAVDDVEEARALVKALHDAGVEDSARVPLGFAWVDAALRPLAALFAIGYPLEDRGVLGGGDGVWILGALLFGAALLVFHFARHRGWLVLQGRDAYVRGARVAMGTVDAWASRMGVRVGGHLRTLPMIAGGAYREHVARHLRAMSVPEEAPAPRVRVVLDDAEAPAAALARLRDEISGAGAYRGAGEAARARLEHAARDPSTPLVDRVIALRVLAKGDEGEVRRRVAEAGGVDVDDAAWLEEVATAESDEDAIDRIRARVPTFEA